MQQDASDLTRHTAGKTGQRASHPRRTISEIIAAVDRTLALWHHRAKYRRELQNLDDRTLKDLQLDPIELGKEAYKPFWRA